jgi:hypothetical protein
MQVETRPVGSFDKGYRAGALHFALFAIRPDVNKLRHALFAHFNALVLILNCKVHRICSRHLNFPHGVIVCCEFLLYPSLYLLNFVILIVFFFSYL